jgi:pyrophosphatase PpaX
VRQTTLLFDLDGTLVDSIGLIVGSMRHAFRGRERVPTDKEWTSRIGTPLRACFGDWAADDADLELLIQGYREFQLANHDRLMTAYDGVAETLALLRARGHRMALVTSKSEELAIRALRHTGLDPYIEEIVGLEACTRHKPDPEPVEVALRRMGANPSEAIFLGDSPYDILSGNAAGVHTIAALWGPFSRAELELASPGDFIERIGDLPGLLERL